MHFRYHGILTLAVLLACLCIGPLRADDLAQAGRTVATKWQNAIVTVKVAAKFTVSYKGQDNTQEAKDEVAGTVVDPSGLVVVSLTAADPTEALAGMLSADGSDDTKASATITDMKILLPDGTEMPASIVLRDKDLGLAFIRPTKQPSKPIASLDLAKAGNPELLDQVVIMYRLGVVANRALSVGVDRVQAVVDKPRKQYVLGVTGISSNDGSPVFGLDGSIVGILLHKVSQSGGSIADKQDFYSVLPAADIAEAAAQAPAADAAKPAQ